MNQMPIGQAVRNRVRQGGRRGAIRAPEISQSTEATIEYDEHEKEALDCLFDHFADKRRFIHPDELIQHIRIPFVSLTAERECSESKLEEDFFKFVALPPTSQNPKVKGKLIQGLSEWLERLEVEKEEMNKGIAEIDKQVKGIDANLEFYQKVASAVGQDPKI